MICLKLKRHKTVEIKKVLKGKVGVDVEINKTWKILTNMYGEKLLSLNKKIKICNNRGNSKGTKIYMKNDLISKESSIQGVI